MSGEEHEDDVGEETEETKARENVTVVVLGDLGHSPRMSYHALSLSQEGFEVTMVGYRGSRPQQEILEDEHITLTYMQPVPTIFNSFPSILRYIGKVIFQAVILAVTLFLNTAKGRVLIMQNPPCIPAMPVCWFYCFLTRTKFIIDWHNYGYSILALTLKPNHLLVRFSYFLERVFGKLAHAGLSVTKAMKMDLEYNWGIKRISVLYDRPAERFHPISDHEKHEMYIKLAEKYKYPCFSSSTPDDTALSERYAERVVFKEDRPAILVSSTSWTEDEDFSILLHALSDYEAVRKEFPSHYPPLIVVITGKGPQKEYYLSLIEEQNWQHVAVVTPWLDASDYPRLLASADLGVSLHYSSSGLDLPMKVVDMFGCGLPVAAINFQALPELVKHNENGLIFETKEELANLLQDWFRGFPKETQLKESYYDFYKNIESFGELRWHHCWTMHALPLFRNG
ncbi:ALG1, chitobiosyldiphosphodolichol beta-mannosyltransferase [Oratosquilla oratoria]|uniref:ALG1, chitobiosyldiphosphodolichol beta-mannosyltransferase n=1 Tax=Oratosquilla oratoria TaxID=337810 RepID=UPI003F76E40B